MCGCRCQYQCSLTTYNPDRISPRYPEQLGEYHEHCDAEHEHVNAIILDPSHILGRVVEVCGALMPDDVLGPKHACFQGRLRLIGEDALSSPGMDQSQLDK